MKEKSSQLSLAVEPSGNSSLLHNFARQKSVYPQLTDPDNADLILTETSNGIQLVWQNKELGQLKYLIDVEAFANQQKTFPAPKQVGFNQAIGKKTRTVIDATGGWAGDTLLMCSQGMQVTLIERNPVMALLLQDAMIRLAKTNWAQQHEVQIPTVIGDDAVSVFKNEVQADCIYLDPMFPGKRKKSAAVNKNMRLLQSLVGADEDAVQLLETALASQCGRVVVKRPDYASPLINQPTQQFSSKLLHYDVYLQN